MIVMRLLEAVLVYAYCILSNVSFIQFTKLLYIPEFWEPTNTSY